MQYHVLYFQCFIFVLITLVGAQVQALKAPGSLSATAISASEIELRWTDNSIRETHFLVERSLSANSGFTQIAKVSADTKVYRNTGLSAQTTYYYRVRGFREALKRYSSYTKVKSATTLADEEDLGDVTPSKLGYSIYFADEFNNLYNGAPNHAVWDYDVNYHRNGEVQCYTENRRQNVRVETRVVNGQYKGVLVLQARKENWACPYAGSQVFAYTSGSIMTRKKSWGDILVDMPHGRYEIRAKVPDTGSGTWPAIWLLGSSDLGSWPNSGEIDIMEQYGAEAARRVQICIHTSSQWITASMAHRTRFIYRHGAYFNFI